MTGLDLRGTGFGQGAAFDREAARAAWFELQDRVYATLADYQRRSHGHYPIRRPWAWWQFEAPEPRNHEISEREQLDDLGISYDEGAEPVHDGSNNGKQLREPEEPESEVLGDDPFLSE